MNTFTGKYIGGIIINDETDIEKLKSIGYDEGLSDEDLKKSIGIGLAFDIPFLEMFWISADRRKILDAGLQLVIQKNPDYEE